MPRGWGVTAGRCCSRADRKRTSSTSPAGRGCRWAARLTLENPFSVFRATDTLFVAEPLKRRLTLWTLDGTFVRNDPASDLVRGALPRARDGAGHFYTELRPSAGPDGSGNRDSAVVVELDGAKVDTVAKLAPIDLAKVASPTGERFERRVFSGVDRWGVYPDGTVWLARVYHNRVDFRLPSGKTEKGQPLPDRVLEVTRADRELFVRKFPEELRGTAEQLPFAPIKAAFTSAFADTQGRIWLEGSRSVSDSVQRYNVVGRDGRLQFVALLPGTGRAHRRVTNPPACRRPDARGHSPAARTDACLSSDPFRYDK